MKGILSKKIIFSAFVFFALPFFVGAQSLELKSSPSYPSPGEMVSVSVSSFGLDLNNSEISWYKDGKLESKGKGIKNFSFSIGENGNTIKSIAKINGGSLESSIKINSSSMDVLWEVVGGYEPPFYKGKIIPIKQSRIKVVAIPQIANSKGLVPSPETFVYSWQKDGSNFAGQSGYGKNSFLYSPGILDKQNSVRVSAAGLSRSLEKSVTITPGSSEVHFYEYSSAYGPLYNKAVKTDQNFNKRKINIIAEPYFIFTKNLKDPSLITEWKVGGRVFATDFPNMIFLDVAQNVNSVDLNFRTNNKTELLQENSRPLRLNITANE